MPVQRRYRTHICAPHAVIRRSYRFDDSPQATIPYTITITPLRPDLVIVSDVNKTVQVLELTVPNNTPANLKEAIDNENKTNRCT